MSEKQWRGILEGLDPLETLKEKNSSKNVKINFVKTGGKVKGFHQPSACCHQIRKRDVGRGPDYPDSDLPSSALRLETAARTPGVQLVF